MASAAFHLKKSGSQFVFNLKAVNGETILTSERYEQRAGVHNGIASVMTNSPNDSLYDRRTAKDGAPYFVLKAPNHEVIGTSETYSSNQKMEEGIASVKTNGPTAHVVDET